MATEERPHAWTIGLSILASILSAFSLWQSCQSAKVTESIARPLVYSTEAKFTKSLTTGQGYIVGTQLKNFGQIPARKIETQFEVQFLPKGTKLNQTFDKNSDSYTEDIIGSQDFTIINFESRTPVSEQDIRDLEDGTRTLFYYGSAKYQTEDTKSGQLAWCWKYKPSVKDFWRCDPEDLQQPQP